MIPRLRLFNRDLLMQRQIKAFFFVVLVTLGVMAQAQNGVITLEAFPSISVADGRSTLTITALIRDDRGSLVPDGTQVIFDTSLGSFRERVVTTNNGYARAVLIASNVPGIARVRASALRFNALGETDVEFVSDRSQLSTAREYFEVSGTETLLYGVQDRVLEATGADKGAVFKYRDITIRADDMQVRVPSYEVKARRAILEYRGKEYAFDELYMRVNRKSGVGLGTIERVVPDPDAKAWGSIPVKTVPYYGVIEISTRGVAPSTEKLDARVFNYVNMSESISRVEAEKAIAFPKKEVQFIDANVVLTGQSIMKVPLFRLPINTTSPIITEQFINVSNNDLAVDYPYYTKLKPGEAQLFRFRWGNRYATGTGAAGGTFLDYEWSWNQGDDMDGGLHVLGLGRNDWGASLRQNWLLDLDSSLSLQVDFPAHKSMYANSNYSKRLGNINANLSGAYGQSLSGTKVTSNSLNMVFEGDPIALSILPARLFLGVSANQAEIKTPTTKNFRQGAGLQARLVSRPWRLDSGTTLHWSYSVSQLTGHNVQNGLSHYANVTMGTSPLPSLSMNLSYEFTDDGFTSDILGQHSLTMDAFYNPGRLSFSGSVSKSLDADRLNGIARMRYEFAPLWGLYYNYTIDQFGPDMFLDQAVILSYRLGYREIGLSYSQRTKRLGIEILGTRFN